MSPTCIGSCCVNPYQEWAKPSPFNWGVAWEADVTLTEPEKEILKKSYEMFSLFADLPNKSDSDKSEFSDAIHRCQQLIALRVARRVNPEIWIQP